MVRSVRTDLAAESYAQCSSQLQGIRSHTRKYDSFEVNTINVDTADAAQRLHKPQGTYATIDCKTLPSVSGEAQNNISCRIAAILSDMLPQNAEVLVVGLGNRFLTADALGPRVVEKIYVTRHLNADNMRSVCAVAPGVLGITGVETAEVVKGLVEHVRPGAVIAVDALAAAACERIATTIQITDSGITPGSGIGNHRKGLTYETLGIPVIAIGVPLVVFASTIASEAFELIDNYENGSDMPAILAKGPLGEMVVTPKEIDELVMRIATTIAMGLNKALHPEISASELISLMH